MNSPTEAALGELQEQLADVARETARLLVQPPKDSVDVQALDKRASTLRARIAAAQPQSKRRKP
jgi:chaperonin cofactor prefoldin